MPERCVKQRKEHIFWGLRINWMCDQYLIFEIWWINLNFDALPQLLSLLITGLSGFNE
jgi:hypothetical protein